MAIRHYTVPLKQPEFPMLSSQAPRTVMQNSETASSGVESPGLIYCHNIMPTSYGFDSIGYISQVPPYSPATTAFTDVRTVYSSDRERFYLAFTSDGSVYALDFGTTFWNKLTISAPTNSEDITVGTVNGISYIFFKNIGAYVYNSATKTLIPTTLVGLDLTKVIGVTASYGYLIAYTENSVAWSSTLDPTDFVPSLTTGAGGGDVSGIGGAIRFIVPNSLGFIIYSDTNAIAGTYTGNVKYPFKYREVDNSKGGISLDRTAYESNSAEQFAYTKAGLQALTSQKAVTLLPEVTDFLAGKEIETFNEATLSFDSIKFNTTLNKKIKFIASRYLVISYGVASFTHAIVYDIVLKRLGKLLIDHADCFEYVGTIGSQVEVSKESIAFLLPTGEVKLVDFSSAAEANGVALFGKFQYTRSRMITLHRVAAEDVEVSYNLNVHSLVSLDGKTYTPYAGIEVYNNNGIREFAFRRTGINHILVLIGRFELNSLILSYTLNGRR